MRADCDMQHGTRQRKHIQNSGKICDKTAAHQRRSHRASQSTAAAVAGGACRRSKASASPCTPQSSSPCSRRVKTRPMPKINSVCRHYMIIHTESEAVLSAEPSLILTAIDTSPLIDFTTSPLTLLTICSTSPLTDLATARTESPLPLWIAGCSSWPSGAADSSVSSPSRASS